MEIGNDGFIDKFQIDIYSELLNEINSDLWKEIFLKLFAESFEELYGFREI